MKLTKKQYEYLKPQASHLAEATHDYLIGVYSDDVIYCKTLYNELGKDVCTNCKNDVLTMYKILGKLYYDYENSKKAKC